MMYTALLMVGLMPFVSYAVAQDADTTTVTMTTTVYDCPETVTDSTTSEICPCETSSPSGQDEPTGTGTLTLLSTMNSTMTITTERPSGIPTGTDSRGYMTTVTSTDTDGVPATLIETCLAAAEVRACTPLSTITAMPMPTSFTSIKYTTAGPSISASSPSCSSLSTGHPPESHSTSSSYSFPSRTSTGSPASTSPPYVTAGAASFRSGSRVGSMVGVLAFVVGVVGGFA